MPPVGNVQMVEFVAKKDTPQELGAVVGMLTGSVEIQNQGPNNLWIAFGPTDVKCVGGKCRQLPPGAFWSFRVFPTLKVWIRSENADQISGAATIITQGL